MISIHAPTRGATLTDCTFFCASKISIHAPTRGATLTICHRSFRIQFQSTLPREERPKHHIYYPLIQYISIHAPTRGATMPPNIRQAAIPYFNPRSHERSDGISVAPEAISEDFNPRSHERSDTQGLLYFYG